MRGSALEPTPVLHLERQLCIVDSALSFIHSPFYAHLQLLQCALWVTCSCRVTLADLFLYLLARLSFNLTTLIY